MKNKTLYILLFVALPWFTNYAWAQIDSLPVVLTILPERNGGYEPVFSPFCKDQVWLGDRAYDIPNQRFLSVDSTMSCLPKTAIHLIGSDRKYPHYLWWQADPYNVRYYWAGESWSDSLFLWRYDQEKGQQSRFVSRAQGYEYLISKAGVWISQQQELILLDRHTGEVLKRAGQAENSIEYSISMRHWGDNVLVNDRNIFQRQQNRYVLFFPLPSDMEGCKSPEKVQFQQEVCGSWYQENDSRQYAYFLSTPDHPPVRLPLYINAEGSSIERLIIASNPPFTWFHFSNKLIAYNINTGDSIVYSGTTGEPLPGEQNGRFMGFSSDLGLSFFDKEHCRFGMLDLPYGYKRPRQFTCNQDYIFLTYENHWEIVNFSKLDSAFQRSLIQEEYKIFEQEYRALFTEKPEDFDVAYAKYIQLYNRYRNSKNPKIADGWYYAKAGIRQALYSISDSLLGKIAVNYEGGRYDPSISCELAQTLFNYYGYHDELVKARRLLNTNTNSSCIEESSNGSYSIALLKTMQFRLDSVQKLKQSKDQRLYAMGKIWWDYGFNKTVFRYSYNPRGDFWQSYHYYRTLIQQYPRSPWADNAAYDTMYYIDYHGTTTDDETPDGNDAQAYEIFNQFLKDYPDSDRRPDVLLRLAAIIQRGLQGPYNNPSGQEQMATYLEIIEREYPDFAKASEIYRMLALSRKTAAWTSRWQLLVTTDQAVYKLTDTIKVIIQFRNRTQTEQTLDTAFLNHWQENLYLYLYQSRDRGCEERAGYFPLVPQRISNINQPVKVPSRAFYEETFILGHTSQIKSYGSRVFDLASGGTYYHFMDYRHPLLPWLKMQATKGEQFRIE